MPDWHENPKPDSDRSRALHNLVKGHERPFKLLSVAPKVERTFAALRVL
jgi:hypothetical protein